jgi:rhodanese-related sulfurtransferase
VRDLPDLQIVDVRNPGEVTSGTAHDAQTIPVGQLPARLDELDAAKPTVVFCAGGYRSSVAASLLRQKGFGDVSDVIGGYTAWIETTQSA